MKKNARGRRRPMPRPDRCKVTGKVRWPDSRAAVEVLHQAHNAAHWAEVNGGTSRRTEVRHYRCPHCRGFHTTSQPEWSAA